MYSFSFVLKKALDLSGLDHRDVGWMVRLVIKTMKRYIEILRVIFGGHVYRMLDIGSSGRRVQPYWFYERHGVLKIDGVDMQDNIGGDLSNDSKNKFKVLLSDREEIVELKFRRHLGCSSILDNSDYLERFDKYPWFEVIGKEEFKTIRADSVFVGEFSYRILKVDTQGYEFKILMGFGGLLQMVDCIEIEAHFIPMYRGESAFEEIRMFLHREGFVLRKIRDTGFVNCELYEVDAFFTRLSPNDPKSVHFFELIHDIGV